MSDMPDDVYKKYSIGSEYSFSIQQLKNSKKADDKYSNCINFKRFYRHCINSNDYEMFNPTDIQTWLFTYSPSSQTLGFEMSIHSLDKCNTIAELIFWYWKDAEIAIMKKTVHTFGVKSRTISVSTKGITPVNKKFNIVIRFLDERTESGSNSLESYYGDYEGLETITLCVAGTDSKETSFVVPKHDLMRASPVFERMFAHDLAEKTTGKVDIKDTNPDEFSDFLKAISPKQEHPNPSNVFALVKLAHLYQFQSLLDRCEAHLMNCVEIPLLELLTCADFYGLNKLKENLMKSIEGTGLFKLFQQMKPRLVMLNLLNKMDDELKKESA